MMPALLTQISALFLISSSIATQSNLCFKLHYKFTGSTQADRLDPVYYSFFRLMKPVNAFPINHAKVVNSVCGSVRAGDIIPEGTSSCTNCKWSLRGISDPASCSSSTSCLYNPLSSTQFQNCNGEGYMNAGGLFYAYNYPVGSSSNNGYEQADTERVFFVQDAADNVWLQLGHDKPGNGGGEVGLRVQGQNAGTVFIAQKDDISADVSSPTTCERSVGTGDCYYWNPTTSRGTFYWQWNDCCTDGMVMGPLPTQTFRISLEYFAFSGLSKFEFGSYEPATRNMSFVGVNSADAQSGVLVEAFTCVDFCSGISSCGECSSTAGQCAWCQQSGRCVAADQTGTQCPGQSLITNNACCATCSGLSGCTSCTAVQGCGWCADTNTCLSGNDGKSCITCSNFVFGTCPSLTSTSTLTRSLSPTQSQTKSLSISVTPTRTVAPSGTPTSTGSTTVTSSQTPSQSRTLSGTPTTSQTPTGTPSSSLTASPTVTPSGTGSQTPTGSPSRTVSISLSATGTPPNTPSSSATSSPTASVSITPTRTATPSSTPTPSNSVTPSQSPSLTASVSTSVSISLTPTQTSTATPSNTPTRSATASQSASVTTGASGSTSSSLTSSASITASSSITASRTQTPTSSTSQTPTNSATKSLTSSTTAEASPSPTSSETQTPTSTTTSSVSGTSTATHTQSSTSTHSPTSTETATSSMTPTPSETATHSPTSTPSNTPTQSRTGSMTQTSSPSQTATQTPTDTVTPTSTSSITASASPSRTVSSTPSVTQTPSNTPTHSLTATVSPTTSLTASNSPSASPSAKCPTENQEPFSDFQIFMTITGLSQAELSTTEIKDLFLAAITQITCGPPVIIDARLADQPCEVSNEPSVRVTVQASLPLSRLDDISSVAVIVRELLRGMAGHVSDDVKVCGVVVVPIVPPNELPKKLGIALGAMGAAAMFVVCCRRKRGSRLRIGVLSETTHKFVPKVLGVERCSEEIDLDTLFDSLDPAGKGKITAADLARVLDISPDQATTLIDEIHATLRARHQIFRVHPSDERSLSRDEFMKLMRPMMDGQQNIVLPKEKLERYKEIFNAIDVDQSGTITPDELAAAVGDDSNTFKDAFVDRTELDFPDFVALLQRSEDHRAISLLLDLMDSQGKHQDVIARLKDRQQSSTSPTPPAIQLPNGSKYQYSRPPTTMSWQNTGDSDATAFDRILSSDSRVPLSTVEDIWKQCSEDRDEVPVSDVRVAIMSAHATGQLPLLDSAIVRIACNLEDLCPDGYVTRNDFMAGMAEFTDGGNVEMFQVPNTQSRAVVVPRRGSLSIRLDLKRNHSVSTSGTFFLRRTKQPVVIPSADAPMIHAQPMSLDRVDSFASDVSDQPLPPLDVQPPQEVPMVVVRDMTTADLHEMLGGSARVFSSAAMLEFLGESSGDDEEAPDFTKVLKVQPPKNPELVRQRSYVGPDLPNLFDAAQKAIEAAEDEIPGITSAFRRHPYQMDTICIADLVLPVMLNGPKVMSQYKGAWHELPKWLRANKTIVRRALYARQQTPAEDVDIR